MDIKKIFGSTLTILGIIVVLYACIAFLSDGRPILGFEVDKLEAMVPFIVGLVFLLSGISLIKRS
jgi:uncharacterized membrane protein